MSDPEEITVDPAEQEVQEVNTSRVSTSKPSGPKKQQWANYYVNYRDGGKVDFHRVAEDALYSIGGFAGIMDNVGMATGGYSYTRAYEAEYQYIDRVNCTGPTHDFSNYISARVDPVFSENLPFLSSSGGEDQEITDERFLEWISNVDGRGVSYLAQNKYLAYQANTHYVSFVVMDKIGDKVRRYARGITSTHEKFITRDETGEMNQIAFLEHFKEDDQGQIVAVQLRRYYMDKGTCWSQKIEADYRPKGSTGGWKDVPLDDYKPIEDPVNSGVDEMIARAFVEWYEPHTGFVPQNPPSKKVVWKYADHNAVHNEHSWLYHAIRNPIIAVWDVKQQAWSGTLGGGISLTTPDDGQSPPKPEFVQPENGAESLADLERSRQDLHNVMRANNVQVTATNQAESGESKSFDFKADNDALGGTVEMLKPIDTWSSKMYDKLTLANIGFYIKYPEDFYPSEEITVADAIDLARELTDKGKFETAEALLQTVLINNIGGSVSREKLSNILVEFENVDRSQDTSDLDNTGDNEE